VLPRARSTYRKDVLELAAGLGMLSDSPSPWPLPYSD
jgi:hypothetical protein